jgi:hypothetical protein
MGTYTLWGHAVQSSPALVADALSIKVTGIPEVNSTMDITLGAKELGGTRHLTRQIEFSPFTKHI